MKRLICIALISILSIALSGCIRPRVTVSDVIGYDIDDARSEVESEDLVPYPIKGTEAPESSLERIVYLQDPAAFKRVPKESGVELTYYTTIPPPPAEGRAWTVLGTALSGCEYLMDELELTHVYFNRRWENKQLMEELGLKVFVNIRNDTVGYPTGEDIVNVINEWSGSPALGGYWSDQLGHEPDICDQPLEKRAWFYETVRKHDPDKQDHPVLEMMDLTEFEDFPGGEYPGWRNSYSEDPPTADVVMIDCYVWNESDEKMVEEITHFFNKFITKYVHRAQLIPQVNAFIYRPGSIRVAYETWKSLLDSEAYDNPYRGEPIGLAYYCDLAIRGDKEMQREIREVNEKILGGE